MPCIIRNIIKKLYPYKDEQTNIVYFPYNGTFDTLLFDIGYQFWGAKEAQRYLWDRTLYAPPTNFHNIPHQFNQMHNITFDLVMCNDRISQYPVARELAHNLHLPLVVIEHSLPGSNIRDEDIKILSDSRQVDYSIAVSDNIAKTWKMEFDVIPYGIEMLEIPQRTKDIDVIVVGKFAPQDYRVVMSITNEFYQSKIIGDNPGLSESMSLDELIPLYSRSKVFLNLSTTPDIPIEMLRAMSMECVVASNPTPAIAPILINNGVIVEEMGQCVQVIKKLLKDDEKRQQLIKNAKKFVKENFNYDNFKTSWQQIINKARNKVYIR